MSLKLAIYDHLQWRSYGEKLAAMSRNKIFHADRAMGPLSILKAAYEMHCQWVYNIIYQRYSKPLSVLQIKRGNRENFAIISHIFP